MTLHLDPFLPRPDNLLVNLNECKELVRDLLKQLPKRFADIHDPGSAMGAALMVAYKLMVTIGSLLLQVLDSHVTFLDSTTNPSFFAISSVNTHRYCK